MSVPDFPLTFRQREVTRIMDAWRTPTSLSVVGVGSVGKSNLLQHLTAGAVQTQYLGEEAGEGFRAIAIDPFMLGAFADDEATPMRFWAGCELLMNRLFMAYYPLDILALPDRQAFNETYAAFQDGTNPLYPYLGLRYFEFALSLLMARGAHIVLLLDECEELFRRMPVQFFLALRGLRDAYKTQICYLTFTRAPLPQVIANLGISDLAIEPFVELFTDNVLYLGAYSEADARDMLDRLAKRRGKTITDAQRQFLLWGTGGHAGLLRAGVNALDTLGAITTSSLPTQADTLLKKFGAKTAVRAEVAVLWNSLSAEEQGLLSIIGNPTPRIRLDDPTTRAVFDGLLKKGFIHSDETLGRLVIEPPLMAIYLAEQQEKPRI